MLSGLALSGYNIARAASPTGTATIEAANMVGVLEYCVAQKHAVAENVAHARSVLAHQPVFPPPAELEHAENLGKDGILLAAGEQHSLGELGRQTQQSVGDICEGLAMNVDTLADMLKPNH